MTGEQRTRQQQTSDHDTSDNHTSEQHHRDVGAIVARWLGDQPGRGAGTEPTTRSGRGHELRPLIRALGGSARTAGRGSVLGGRWLTNLLVDIAPRIPVRDRATLLAHHPGLPDDDLAEVLVAGAAKSTGAVGAAGGALAAVEFAAPPALLTTPFQLAAETLLVVLIEVKLIAELHEVYGVRAPGSARERAGAYLVAWTNRRGVDPLDPSALRLALGGATRAALRRRVVRRGARNVTTLGPMLSGAVAGSMVNHRETRKVGNAVRADLRRLTGR
jgi:hypothetical protein